MPGWSIGIPAKECKTGSKLRAVKGSVCEDCYALKGCYVFKVVQDAQYRRTSQIKMAPNLQIPGIFSIATYRSGLGDQILQKYFYSDVWPIFL